jgi:hypothetical protein
MRIADDLICDPAGFIDGRTALSLSELGLTVLEADFGESDIEVFYERQALGEIPTDRHPPNKEMTFKLRVAKEGETDLPTAAYNLQQKIGLWQREGGWLGRDFKLDGDEGGFAGSLGCQVKKAMLSGISGWQRGASPDVTLQLVTGPYWYADEEIESTVFEETSARELIAELENMLGTAPGLIRCKVTNANASAHWRGLDVSAESRDYPEEGASTTAALAYAATALTRKGGATEAERESQKVVRHSALTAGWLTILDSEVAGVGHMTHRGVRHVSMRVYDPGSEAGNVKLRLRWRALGTISWSENSIVPTPLVGGWSIVDLGECRPEIAALGDERWEWQLEARAVNGSGAVDVHRVRIDPAEQWARLTSPEAPISADAQSQKSPGTVADDSSTGTVAWTNPGNAKASDNSYATATFTSLAESHYLKATNFGFALPEAATITGILATVERHAGENVAHWIVDQEASILKGGTPLKGSHSVLKWPLADTVASYGGGLWGTTWTPADINSSSFGFRLSVEGLGTTASVDQVAITVYYTEAEDENRVCFATRSIELRTDGCFRQHPTDDVWGRLVPEGFLPYAPPGGMENRKMRIMVVPSQGDFGEAADSGTNKVQLQVLYRPAFHYSREAS